MAPSAPLGTDDVRPWTHLQWKRACPSQVSARGRGAAGQCRKGSGARPRRSPSGVPNPGPGTGRCAKPEREGPIRRPGEVGPSAPGPSCVGAGPERLSGKPKKRRCGGVGSPRGVGCGASLDPYPFSLPAIATARSTLASTDTPPPPKLENKIYFNYSYLTPPSYIVEESKNFLTYRKFICIALFSLGSPSQRNPRSNSSPIIHVSTKKDLSSMTSIWGAARDADPDPVRKIDARCNWGVFGSTLPPSVWKRAQFEEMALWHIGRRPGRTSFASPDHVFFGKRLAIC